MKKTNNFTKQILGKSNSFKVFHGGYKPIEKPSTKVNKYTKDFGPGFYVTALKQQADLWAEKFRPKSTVSIYTLPMELPSDFRVLKFKSMTEEWLDFIVDCRLGKPHKYDIVEGPMADDTIFLSVMDYIKGDISREMFWIMVKFKKPTHQICFCSERSIYSLRYERSYRL